MDLVFETVLGLPSNFQPFANLLRPGPVIDLPSLVVVSRLLLVDPRKLITVGIALRIGNRDYVHLVIYVENRLGQQPNSSSWKPRFESSLLQSPVL